MNVYPWFIDLQSFQYIAMMEIFGKQKEMLIIPSSFVGISL